MGYSLKNTKYIVKIIKNYYLVLIVSFLFFYYVLFVCEHLDQLSWRRQHHIHYIYVLFRGQVAHVVFYRGYVKISLCSTYTGGPCGFDEFSHVVWDFVPVWKFCYTARIYVSLKVAGLRHFLQGFVLSLGFFVVSYHL